MKRKNTLRTIKVLIIALITIEAATLAINAWDFAKDHQEFMIERGVDSL